MKKIILAAIAVLGVAGAAEATTFSVDVAATPYRDPGNPGLQTRAWILSPGGPQNYNGSTVVLDATAAPATVDLFGLVQFDTPINADDVIPHAITVDFTVGGVTKTISGVTYADPEGHTLPSYVGHAVADFVNTPLDFYTGTGHLLISLFDTTFGKDTNGDFTNGRPGFGKVTAQYSFVSAVPLPAALPLGMGAIGLMGFVARRRKNKNV